MTITSHLGTRGLIPVRGTYLSSTVVSFRRSLFIHVDWIIADILAVRQNALGHVRYVLKDGLKWLPLYGCYFSQHGGIYVKRSAKFNEKEMRSKLQSYMNAGTPMYLVIFPEGTRYNPELTKVISASQTFAAQEGFAVLKHVLTPRIKATHVAFDSMKNYLDAIYDVTVAFEGTVDDKGQRKEAPSMAGCLLNFMIHWIQKEETNFLGKVLILN
eukprot:XP_013975644.1 1-acyl-sn-glycerol-3-phosphate acyltransferase epsilon isoform X3 [Canis lupus familiaris]